MADGGRIRGADPLTLGLAAGIPAGINNFIRFQELGMRKNRFAQEEEETKRKQRLDAALPDFLRKLVGPEGGSQGGGLALPATPAGAFAPSPAVGGGRCGRVCSWRSPRSRFAGRKVCTPHTGRTTFAGRIN